METHLLPQPGHIWWHRNSVRRARHLVCCTKSKAPLSARITELQGELVAVNSRERALSKDLEECSLERLRLMKEIARTRQTNAMGLAPRQQHVINTEKESLNPKGSDSVAPLSVLPSVRRKGKKKRSKSLAALRAALPTDRNQSSSSSSEHTNVPTSSTSPVKTAPQNVMYASGALHGRPAGVRGGQDVASGDQQTSSPLSDKEDSKASPLSDEGAYTADLLPKAIFVISDCTGESASHAVRAALGQFEQHVGLRCPVSLIVFRFVDTEERLTDIISRAAEEDALVVYTLASPQLVQVIEELCDQHSIRSVDMWTTLLDFLESHLETTRSFEPRFAIVSPETRKRPALSKHYFEWVEAVEWTRKHDDGCSASTWHEGDLLLVGVSRAGKTPLSIFLGQRGFKVANLPLVPEVPLPKELFELDPSKVVALTIDAKLLSMIRHHRMGAMGVSVNDSPNNSIEYEDFNSVKKELAWAEELYDKNPDWTVLDVTFCSVEETAARIMQMMSQKFGTASKWHSNGLVLQGGKGG